MNWFEDWTIPAKMQYIPCRHHVEPEHLGAGSTDQNKTEEDRTRKQGQADQVTKKYPLLPLYFVPTLVNTRGWKSGGDAVTTV